MNEIDPYDRDENAFRTDGRDVCHWCALRPQAWLWGPYGTRVRDHCQQMIEAGRAGDVVEEVAARITVLGRLAHGRPRPMARTRAHPHDARWLQVRTTYRPVSPGCPGHGY